MLQWIFIPHIWMARVVKGLRGASGQIWNDTEGHIDLFLRILVLEASGLRITAVNKQTFKKTTHHFLITNSHCAGYFLLIFLFLIITLHG